MTNSIVSEESIYCSYSIIVIQPEKIWCILVAFGLYDGLKWAQRLFSVLFSSWWPKLTDKNTAFLESYVTLMISSKPDAYLIIGTQLEWKWCIFVVSGLHDGFKTLRGQSLLFYLRHGLAIGNKINTLQFWELSWQHDELNRLRCQFWIC